MVKVIGVLVVAGLVIGVLVLGGCGGSVGYYESPESQKLRAQAELEAARAAADVSRAESRQFEADRAHGRVMESLPYIVAIGGGLLLAMFGGLLFWAMMRDRPRPAPGVDPAVLLLVDEQRRRLADVERAAWRLVADEQRRQLVGERRVTIYDADGTTRQG